MTVKITKEQIENAVSSNYSMAQAAKSLNMAFSTFKRYAVNQGIYTPNQGNSGVLLSEDIKLARLDDILLGNSTRHVQSSKLKQRLVSANILNNMCALCGVGAEWNGKQLTLQLDHIDGNSHNNTLSNLRILCPNCHSQTPTFSGKNASKSPKTRVDYSKLQSIIDSHNPKTMRELLTLIGVTDSQANYITLNRKMIEHKVKTEITLTCTSCKQSIKGGGKTGLCSVCVAKENRRVNRPSRDELITLLKSSSIYGLAKSIGVSDNAIRKWMIGYSIPTKRNELCIFMKSLNHGV